MEISSLAGLCKGKNKEKGSIVGKKDLLKVMKGFSGIIRWKKWGN